MDANNDNTLFPDTTEREMNNNAFEFDVHENLEPGVPKKAPRGYKKAPIHIIFDVKLDSSFPCKSILVASGHLK